MAKNGGFGIRLDVEDRSKEALEELDKALEIGLTECGLNLERWAKEACPVADPTKWKTPPKYTYIGGTLRNSITFALDGHMTNDSSYKVEAGNKGAPGRYQGQAPSEWGKGRKAVYLGTNVYYAPYVEMGTYRMAARPFISKAMKEHRDELKETLEKALEGTTGSIR